MNYLKIKYFLISGNIIKKVKRKLFKKFFEYPISKLVYLFPIKKNRIVIDNFGGKGYGDNPKYITNELIISGCNYDLIWLVDNLASYDFPQQI